MNHISYAYPARFERDEDAYWFVTFRDLPECATNARDYDEAVAMAIDVLTVGLWFILRDGKEIPPPSRPLRGEVLIEPEPAIVLKLALRRAAGGRRGAAAKIARALGIDHKEARRLLDPTQVNRADRLARALALFGGRVSTTVTLAESSAAKAA